MSLHMLLRLSRSCTSPQGNVIQPLKFGVNSLLSTCFCHSESNDNAQRFIEIKGDMEESTHWRHGRVKMISPSIKTNDAHFPFSPSIVRASGVNQTLPSSFVQNLLPPIEVVTKLYYNDMTTTFDDGSLRARTGHGDPYAAPRQMQREEAWRNITSQDFKYACGFKSGIKLVGMTTRHQDDNVAMPYRPAMEQGQHL